MTEDRIFLGWSRASGVPVCAGRKGVVLGVSSAPGPSWTNMDPGFNFGTLWSLLLSDEPGCLGMSPVSLISPGRNVVELYRRPDSSQNRHHLLKHRFLIQVPP
jgi:hypothetical protein